MKFIVLLFFVLLNSLSLSVYAQEKLIILSWEDYMDPELIRVFEKKNNITIEFIYFEHDEERDELIAAADLSYDIYMLDGQSISTHFRLGWLAPITLKDAPNLKNYNTFWHEYRPEAKGYTVPYSWGSTGFVYRQDLLPVKIDTLKSLFNPPEALHGKIIMTPQIFELVPAALLALGLDANSIDSNDIKQAEKLILQQQPFVHSYRALELQKESPLVTGEAWIAYGYGGDALSLAQFNKNISYLVPQEGGPLWMDFLVVSSKSNKKEMAYRFLNYMSETQAVLQNMYTTYSASFNDEANASLPQEMKENTAIFYPDIHKLSMTYEPDPRGARKFMSILQALNLDVE